MHYDQSTVHPRTDFPQTGWMGKVPLGLVDEELFHFNVAVGQLTNSFMVAAGPHLQAQHQKWVQDSPFIWFAADQVVASWSGIFRQQLDTPSTFRRSVWYQFISTWGAGLDWISVVLDGVVAGRKRPIAPWVKRKRLVKAHKRV